MWKVRRFAAVAAVAAGALLVSAAPARADQGQPVLAGVLNTSTADTTISNHGSGGGLYALAATSGGRGVSGVGFGANGVGAGVYGYSYNDDGVVGFADQTGGRNGVMGVSANPNASGVYGENNGLGYGVAGRSGGIAVYGDSTQSYGIGVQGSNSQQGGVGVYGSAGPSGTGVYATNPSGLALSVNGRAQFSRSGRITVPAGQYSATASSVSLTSTSLVMATMQQRRAGISIEAAVPNTATSSFTVYLSKAVPSDTVIAWFVVN
jgi:hypothetical protein